MKLTDKCLADFTSHVLSEYPQEACGLVVNDQYISCKNTSETPLESFKIDPKLYVKAEKKGKVQAVLHSHPYSLQRRQKWPFEWPSSADMTNWMAGEIPWGIVATEGEGITQMLWLDDSEIAPLIGREFVHGVHDCYSLIRDWFKLERDIKLPNFPRQIDWWLQGKDLYSENFKTAGFVEIHRDQADIGDVILMQAVSSVINHGAVITGSNEILHHMFHRLSGRDRLDRWERKIEKVVRYVGAKEC